MGKEDRSAFHRVGATGKEAHDRTGHIGENCDSIEGALVKKARFVVVSYHEMSVKRVLEGGPGFGPTGEEATTRKNVKEGIEIVGVGTIKPVEEHLCVATGDAGENLKRRVGWSVRTRLAAHHDNAAIGQN